MANPDHEFRAHVCRLIKRFVAQNGGPNIADAVLDRIAENVWAIVRRRGLPHPLAPHEQGAPGGMAEDECSALVSEALTGATEYPLVRDAVRQILKACTHPEFKTCRDTFRELSTDGSCRRQELARVLQRVSGTHCVDCPYYISLDAERHAAFLRRNWRAGPEAFEAHRAIFLPEDFRAFRRWIHAAARAPGCLNHGGPV